MRVLDIKGLCLCLLSLLYFLLPLSADVLLASPVWPLLVLCRFQGRVSETGLLWLAAITGGCMDVIMTVLWGEHLLAMVIAVFVCCRLQRELSRCAWSRQCIVILGVVWLYAMVVFLVESVMGQPIETDWLWFSPVTSLFVWPWVRIIARGRAL